MSLEITCPNCFRANRVPKARLDDKPKCGHCKKHLFNQNPAVMDDDSAKHYFRHTDIPLVVDFWAEWCGPCQQMTIEFTKAAKSLEPHFRLVKVNVDQSQALAQRYGVRSIPTLMIFAKGKEIDRHIGAMSSAQLETWVNAVAVNH